jgi:hypothetical protein
MRQLVRLGRPYISATYKEIERPEVDLIRGCDLSTPDGGVAARRGRTGWRQASEV